MRGSDARSGELFSYVDLEKRVPEKHPRVKLNGSAVGGIVAGSRLGISTRVPG
jgi:hypothetical protein